MTSTVTPVFFVGSGRCGTAAIARALDGRDDIEIHHEYLCTHVQPLAVEYYSGRIDTPAAVQALAPLHGRAIQLCDRPLWADCSNKLSWLIPPLAAMFPHARFVHLVRDGRKVTSSYFNKLGAECYDDRSTAILARYLAGEGGKPPPEKRYWWPQPQAGHKLRDAFNGYDQFQRIAFHWAEVNLVIDGHLSGLTSPQWARFRLEDLHEDPTEVSRLMDFVGLDGTAEVAAQLARPHNVAVPRDTLLTDRQRAQFDAIAGDAMASLGYADSPEYRVNYAGRMHA